jgi:hypothetical protein
LLRVRFIEGALQLFQLLSGFAELAFLRRWWSAHDADQFLVVQALVFSK